MMCAHIGNVWNVPQSDGTLRTACGTCGEVLATRPLTDTEAMASTLARRGWTLRRCEPMRPDSRRYVIMARRDLPGLDGHGFERFEYVIATMLPTDREWNAGAYVRTPEAADAAYRHRASLTKPGSPR